MNKAVSLIGFLALVFIIGGVASYVTMSEVPMHPAQAKTWYQSLNQPSWQPPADAFGPVWTAIYIMTAISGWLVWRKLPTNKFSQKLTSLIMAPYWLQLLLNFLWSIFFFNMHQPVLSLLDISMMLIVIGLNIGTFIKVSKAAAYLLVPYFIWVAYATALNAATVVLN